MQKVLRSGADLSAGQRLTYIVLLGLSMSIFPYTIDPLLPAFPRIGDYFGVTDNVMQLTLAGVTAGFAVGQLFAGPLSDSLGRRRPIQVGFAIYILGCLAATIAPSVEIFAVARFFQGAGASVVLILCIAIVRDLYVGNAMIKMLSRVMLLQGLAPILGPIFGSQLLRIFTWQQVMYVIAAYAAIMFILMRIFLIETLHSDDRRSQGLNGMWRRFYSVLHDRIYVGLLIVSAGQFVALFGYLNTSSFIYQDTYHLSPAEFGFWFAFNSVTSFFGTQIAAKLSRVYQPQWVLFAIIVFSLAASVAIVIAGLNNAPFIVVTLLISFFTMNFGAAMTPTQSIMLAPHGEEAGTAASLSGVLNFVMTSAATFAYAMIDTSNVANLGWFMAGLLTVSLLAMVFVVRPRTVPALVNN